MRILFFSHYFPPEINAPATRTYEHCVRWAREGHDVTVVTGVPNCPEGVVYPGYRNRFRPQVEEVDGIQVVRVWTHVTANSGTMRRIANYLSYAVSAVIASLRIPKPDVLLATSPQLFCGCAGAIASRIHRVPFVLEVRDIWPESIAAVGAIRKPRLLSFLEGIERWMYRSASHVVAVGAGYKSKILEKVACDDRISVLTNGVDLSRFAANGKDVDLLKWWNLNDRFVCSYVGTIGMAHGLEVVIDAARILKRRGRSDIAFCLVGDGAERAELERKAQAANVDDAVVFTGRQPRTAIPSILASSDACLVHLKHSELFKTVIPSKIFEAMAMRCPIILGVEGETREIIDRAHAGVPIKPGCAESLAEAVQDFADDPQLRRSFGSSGRSYVAAHYNRDVLADRFLRLLEDIVDAPRSAAPAVNPALASGGSLAGGRGNGQELDVEASVRERSLRITG